MKPEDEARFAACMVSFAETYRVKIGEVHLRWYRKAIEPYPIRIIERATENLLLSMRRCPTPADLRQECREHGRYLDPSGAERQLPPKPITELDRAFGEACLEHLKELIPIGGSKYHPGGWPTGRHVAWIREMGTRFPTLFGEQTELGTVEEWAEEWPPYTTGRP